MKRLLTIILVLCLLLGTLSVLASCNGGKNPSESTTDGTTQSTERETTGASTDKPTEPSTTEAPTQQDTTEAQTAGDTTESETQGDADGLPEAGATLTVKEAAALSAVLENKVFTEGKYYVTGTVDQILSIIGAMIICDDEGNMININASYNADGSLGFAQMADKPEAGDKITVFGVIGRSGSEAQMKNVWIVDFCDPDAPETTEGETNALETTEDATDAPETTEGETNAPETTEVATDAPETTDGETNAPETTEGETNAPETTEGETNPPETTEGATDAPETEPDLYLTLEEAIALGKSMEHNKYTEIKYYITGTVKKAVLNNLTITDDKGNELTVYGAYNEDGTVKYSAMTEKPAVGDTVTVYGIIGQNNNSARMKDGWIMSFTTPEAPETTEPETTEPETTAPSIPDTPVNPPVTPDEPVTPPDIEEGDTVVEDGIVYPDDPDIETVGKPEEEEPDEDIISCHPRWAYDSGYHWSPACDNAEGHANKLPKEAGDKIMHTLFCTIEDEGDVIVYSYTCSRCEYTTCRLEVPYDSNMYIDAATLGEVEHNFGKGSATIVSGDGFAATRYTSVEGSGDHVTVYEDNSNTLATGKYMLVRIKLGNGRSGFRVELSSTNAYSANSTGDSAVFATVGGVNSGWTTTIIDISKIVEDQLGYSASSDGEYYLHKASIYVDGMAKGDSFDLAYVAFCDTLEDAIAFAEQDGALYVYDNLMLSPEPAQKLGTVCDHTYDRTQFTHTSEPCDVCLDPGGEVSHSYLMLIEKNSEGKVTKYGGSCICGRAAPDKHITDDINFFSMPGQLYNRWNTGGLVKNYYRTGLVMSDGEQIFTRVSLQAGASFAITNETSDYKGDGSVSEISGGAGRYLVFRLKATGVSKIALWVDDTKTAGWKDNQCVWRDGEDIVDDNWYTYVVDMEALAYKFYDCDDKTTTHISAGLRGEPNANCSDDTHETCNAHYIDLAYFAICDDWAEVAKVSGDEKIYYTAWTGAKRLNEVNKQGQCISDHVPVIDTSVSGQIKYNCYVCHKTLQTITLSDNINYYSAPSQQINNWATSNITSDGGDCQNVYTDLQGTKAWLTDVRYDAENGVYTRINLYQGASFYMGTTGSSLTNRNDKLDSNKIISDSLRTGNGCGKFAVLKVRSINNGTVSFMVTTNTGKNFGWVHRSETEDITSGEFHTYVVPMDSVNDPSATSVRVLIRTDSGKALRGACVDVAYFAIVDDWSEVAELAANEDVIYYTTWDNGAPLQEKSPTGGCAQHVPVFQSSTNGVTKYDCASCGGVAVDSVSCPENVNFYSAPGLTYNNWNTGSQNNGAVGRHNLLYYDETDGFMYSRIKMFLGGSFECANGSATVQKGFSDCSDTISGGSGKYLVFKIRVSANVSYLRLMLADGKKATSVGGEVRGAPNETLFEQGGVWRVYVVDIEKMNSSAYGVNDSSVTKVTFGFQGEAGENEIQGGEYIDFAYFAVCDDWTEVKAVVGEKDKVIYTAWNNNDFDEIRNSDGTPVENTAE